MVAGTAVIRKRAIEFFEQNVTQTEIATRLGVSRVTINQWAKIYREGGAEALLQRARMGRVRRLKEDQRREIASWLAMSPRDQGLDAKQWTAREVATLIRSRFGVIHTPTYCLALCRSMGLPLRAAYRPPTTARRSATSVRGRPAKISGPVAARLCSDLLIADRGRAPHGWTRQEIVELIKEKTGIVYSADSISALLKRLGVWLEIIPERQRRIETRPRPPQRQRGRRLTTAQITELHGALKVRADTSEWSAEQVRSFIWDRFRVNYALSYVPHLLRELGVLIRYSARLPTRTRRGSAGKGTIHRRRRSQASANPGRS